jgi:hypothetical protein
MGWLPLHGIIAYIGFFSDIRIGWLWLSCSLDPLVLVTRRSAFLFAALWLHAVVLRAVDPSSVSLRVACSGRRRRPYRIPC